MERLSEPYTIRYPQIVAVADESGEHVELIEFFDCTGGAMVGEAPLCAEPARPLRPDRGSDQPLPSFDWQRRPRARGLDLPGRDRRCSRRWGRDRHPPTGVLGGGGVGASICRASAPGVVRYRSDPAGGGRLAGSTIWLPRRERVIIGIDDTDTPEEGATWTLAHNIARAVEDEHSRYLSHTIVQLYPVPHRTKNCVAIACEFATSDPDGLTRRYHDYLETYTLSEETGMAVWRGFDPAPLEELAGASSRVRSQPDDLATLDDHLSHHHERPGHDRGGGGDPVLLRGMRRR